MIVLSLHLISHSDKHRVQISCDADTQGSSLITILVAPVLLTSALPQQRLHRWDSFRHK